MNKNKLRKLLNAITPDETAADFSQFDNSIATLKENLKEKITAKTLEDVNIQLEKFRKRIDLSPLTDSVKKIGEDYSGKIENLKSDLQAKLTELGEVIAKNDQIDSEYINQLQVDITAIKGQLLDLGTSRLEDIQSLENKIIEVGKISGQIDTLAKSLQENVTALAKNDSNSEKELKKEVKLFQDALEKLRKELLQRINNIGGGAMNRQIKIGGTDYLTKYTDINLVAGTGISITAADDNTDKNVDITFTATGDQSVTLADVSANSLTTPNSLYQMTSTIPVEFRSSDGNTILYIDETNEWIRTPKIVGSTSTTGDLTFQTTSGVGASGADMHFLVGNNGATEAMTILNSGFIGMGTVLPEAKFHVMVSDATATGDPNAALILEKNGDTIFQLLGPNTSTQYILFGDPQSGSPGRIQYDHSVNAMSLYTNDAVAMTILTSGFVGLGTGTAVDELLHIQSSTSGKPVFKIENTAGDSESGQIRFQSIAGSSWNLGRTSWYGGADEYMLEIVRASNVTNNQESVQLIWNMLMSDVQYSILNINMYNGTDNQGYIKFNEDARDVDYSFGTIGHATALFIQGSNGDVGIKIGTPDGTLHVHTATAGSVAAIATYDDLVVENSSANGMTFLVPAGEHSSVVFGRVGDADAGQIQYDHGADKFNFYTASVERWNITSTGALVSVGGRLEEKQGADVASTTNLVLGTDGNVFEITGTTKIDLISNASWQNGSKITLIANENVTIDNGTATSGANITIKLAGASDFAMTADDTLTLVLSETTAGGVAWREVSRSAN